MKEDKREVLPPDEAALVIIPSLNKDSVTSDKAQSPQCTALFKQVFELPGSAYTMRATV